MYIGGQAWMVAVRGGTGRDDGGANTPVAESARVPGLARPVQGSYRDHCHKLVSHVGTPQVDTTC